MMRRTMVERRGPWSLRLIGLVTMILPWSPSVTAAPPPEDERNTTEIYEQSSRSVVHIESRVTAESRFARGDRERRTGTGFVIDPEGRILTAFHVIEDMNEIDVILEGGRRLPARLVGTAPQLDIALLQVDVSEELPAPLPLGDSRALRVGQKVLAIGNPFGFHNTLTVGMVSSLGRTADGQTLELGETLIQTDAAINPGNSGGPLLDSSGQVVGINRAVIERAENVGFAVPIHLVVQVIPDLIEMGHPYEPQLGFTGGALSPRIAKLFGLPIDHGFLVEEVFPNGPAGMAGLRAGNRIVVLGDEVFVLGGDVIIAVNDQPLTTESQLARALLASRPGETLRFMVHREGKEMEIAIPLEKMRM